MSANEKERVKNLCTREMVFLYSFSYDWIFRMNISSLLISTKPNVYICAFVCTHLYGSSENDFSSIARFMIAINPNEIVHKFFFNETIAHTHTHTKKGEKNVNQQQQQQKIRPNAFSEYSTYTLGVIQLSESNESNSIDSLVVFFSNIFCNILIYIEYKWRFIAIHGNGQLPLFVFCFFLHMFVL